MFHYHDQSNIINQVLLNADRQSAKCRNLNRDSRKLYDHKDKPLQFMVNKSQDMMRWHLVYWLLSFCKINNEVVAVNCRSLERQLLNPKYNYQRNGYFIVAVTLPSWFFNLEIFAAAQMFTWLYLLNFVIAFQWNESTEVHIALLLLHLLRADVKRWTLQSWMRTWMVTDMSIKTDSRMSKSIIKRKSEQ